MKMKLKKGAALASVLLMAAGISFAAYNNNVKHKRANYTVSVKDTSSGSHAYSGPDVSFTDEKGKVVSLKSLKGKVVFINFWATWCPPCIHEMPAINKLKQSFKGNANIVFLMVDVDGDIGKSQAFMEENKYDLPVYVPNGKIPVNFLRGAIPTTVILAKNGDMIARIEGGRDYTSPKVKKALDELIKSN